MDRTLYNTTVHSVKPPIRLMQSKLLAPSPAAPLRDPGNHAPLLRSGGTRRHCHHDSLRARRSFIWPLLLQPQPYAAGGLGKRRG
jgi:hypothetical protein